jgi:hypothetical protein
MRPERQVTRFRPTRAKVAPVAGQARQVEVNFTVKPGASQPVRLVLDGRAFSLFDPARKAWLVEPGAFEVRVGGSSRLIRFPQTVTVQ